MLSTQNILYQQTHDIIKYGNCKWFETMRVSNHLHAMKFIWCWHTFEQWFSFSHTKVLITGIEHAVDLYFEDYHFESRPGYWLPQMRYCVVFLTLHANIWVISWSDHKCFLPNHSPAIISWILYDIGHYNHLNKPLTFWWWKHSLQHFAHATELCYDVLQDSEIIIILTYINQKRLGLSYFNVFLRISGV